MVPVNHINHAATFRRSKSRSKSRSPGREIDRAAIVIVHHHTSCTAHRAASPDNLSESSISFHENEVNFDLSPGAMTRPLPGAVDPSVSEAVGEAGLWYEDDPHGCVSVCREGAPPHPRPAPNSRTIQYSNWESCRESWFSSGSR